MIEVDTLAEQRDAYFEASSRGDKLAMADIWTMHGKGADLSNTRTRDLKGVGSPPYHYNCRTITVAYWETPAEIAAPDDAPDPAHNLDHWKRAAYDRERLSRKQVEAVIERAKAANWAKGAKGDIARDHFVKHSAALKIDDQPAFSQSAIDNIRRGRRDLYLSVRNGSLRGSFVRPARHAVKGRPGFIVTVVDLEANKITSHHWRYKLETSGDEVPAFKQPGRGIMKWLFG